ncbi:serine/threonine protein kinase [Gordonia iterans]
MSTSPPRSGTALLRAWPASALALWATAWRAGVVAPDDAVHTLHDYAQAHEVDAAPGTGIMSSDSVLDLLRLVGRASAGAVVLPAPGDAQGLPPRVLNDDVLAAGEVLLLAPEAGGRLAMTARGTAERCRWTVRALDDSVDIEAIGADQTAGELEYELREAVAEAATVIAGLSGPRTSGPADLRDALAARTRALGLDLPPHDRQRVDRMLATAGQIDAIISLVASTGLGSGGGLGVSAEQVASADAQLRRLAALTRRARAAAVNTLLRDFRREL